MNILIKLLKKYKNKKKLKDYNNEQRLIKRRLFKTVTTTMEELDMDLSNILKKG
jgi:hypothetical protein